MYDDDQTQDTTPMNLAEIHRISEELIETGKIPAIKRKYVDYLKNETAARTNAYLKTTPDVAMFIRTPETGTDARIRSIKPSKNKGWMIIDCFTVQGEYLLEVTINWPLITYMKWYP